MARKEVTITLIDPVIGHKGMITSIKLLEPSASDVFKMGELQVVSQNRDGSSVYIDRPEIYEQYLEHCLVGEDKMLVSTQLSLADGYQARRAINGFFSDAQSKAFEHLERSSSGSSASSPAPTSSPAPQATLS